MARGWLASAAAAWLVASHAPASAAAPAAPAAPAADAWCLEHAECGEGNLCVAARCRPASSPDIVRLYPLAVSPFVDLSPGGAGEQMALDAPEILRGFLRSTLFFEVVDERRTPATAPVEGWAPSSIDWASWYALGAHALIKGTIERVPGDELVLDLRFYLIESGERVSLKHDRQVVTPETLREVLGRFCDDLLVELTGRPGVFETRLAFAKRVGSQPKQVAVVGLDGVGETPVTTNRAINLLPAWTRDGQRVAWTSYVDGNPDLWLGEQKLSGYESLNTGADFSPDGREVALTLSKDGNAEIYVLNAKSGAIKRRLTRSPSIDSSPSWSPDGQRIAFLSDRGGSPQIYVMDRSGAGQTRVPQTGGYNTSPDWHPSANLIAYNTMVTSTRFDIFVIDLDTGRTTRLTNGPGSNEEPSWSPDGRWIAFTSTRLGQKQLWVMSADGRLAAPISRGSGEYFTPAWSPVPGELPPDEPVAEEEPPAEPEEGAEEQAGPTEPAVRVPTGPPMSGPGSEGYVPQGPPMSGPGSEGYEPQGPPMSGPGSERTVPQGPPMSGPGSEGYEPQGPAATERDSEGQVPQGPPMTGPGSEGYVPQGPPMTGPGSERPVPQGTP